MAVTAKMFGNAIIKAMNKEIKWNSTGGDTIKVLLYTGTIPATAQDTWVYKSNIATLVEVATGGGYTQGTGQTITVTNPVYYSPTTATAWATTTTYTVGAIRRPTTANGYVYQCIQAGTSGGTEPTWGTPTLGIDITDGTVKWQAVGRGFIMFDGSDVTWSSSTISATTGIILVDTGTASTSSLLGYVDFGGTTSSSNGNFTITWDVAGIFNIIIQ